MKKRILMPENLSPLEESLQSEDLYGQNYLLLQERFPQWIEPVDGAESSYLYDLRVSRVGVPTVNLVKDAQSVSYHSAYNPLAEAERLIQAVPDCELLILAGLGLGYLLEEALRQLSCEVLLWDCDWMMLKKCMRVRDMREMLTHPRAHLLFSENPQLLIEKLKSFQTAKIHLLVHKPSEKVFPDAYAKVREALSYFKSSREMNIATLNRFERLWTRNILKNLPDFLSFPGINNVAGLFQGIPCIIVAAGPSLMKNIHELKYIKGRAVLIAVDTSFQILQAHGIDPDFVLVVDPQDINTKYFEYLKPSEAILVVEPSVSPKILRRYPGRKLILGSVFHLIRYLEKFTGAKGNIDIGGSVATAAYSFALLLGGDPLIFTGLDLAYSQLHTHMKGSYFEENWFYSWTRFVNNHSRTRKLLQNFALFRVKGYQGESLWTDRKFEMFQKWFESQFQKATVHIINASEGGVILKNAESLPLSGAVSRHIPKEQNPSLVQKLHSLNPQETNIDPLKKHLAAGIENLLQQFRHLFDAVTRAQTLSKDFYSLTAHRKNHKDIRRLAARAPEIHRELDRIDALIRADATVNALMSIVMQSTIHNISDKSLSTPQQNTHSAQLQNIKDSQLLYQGILDSLCFNIKYFMRASQQLKTS